jgi:dTDP-glucose pyrophosphorylase
VREYYGDGSRFKCNITYIHHGEPLGIAHAISLTKDFVGDEKFVVVLGDNLIGGNITELAFKFETPTTMHYCCYLKPLIPGISVLLNSLEMENLLN